jgi:beta-glucuronidase
MSPRLLIAVLLLGLLSAAAPAAAQTPSPTPAPAAASVPPDEVPLTKGWEFRFDATDLGSKEGWGKSPQPQEDWADVTVPHLFDPNPTTEKFLGTIGWYRLKFPTPATPAGFSWALNFQGARRVAKVWLNGRKLGRNGNPYQPFTLRADRLRTDGQPNQLVVRVQNKRDPELREGWWNWGGLVRSVSLIPHGKVVWEDVGILSDVDCTRGSSGCGAIVRTDGWLENRTTETLSPVLVLQLRAPDGTLTSKTVRVSDLQPGERRRVGFPAAIKGSPALWSPVHPHLYDAQVEVYAGPQRQQLETRRIGLRYIRVQNGMLYLNGHRLQLRGASIQEDLPGRGPALRDEDNEKIIGDLKALGANVTRAQYPLNDRLLSRLDEEGILVWSQAPVYHEDRYLEHAAGRTRAYRKVRGTILYARNHPSVMTHSVANELTTRPDEKPGTAAFMRRAAAIARDLDHTVPVSLDVLSYPRIAKQQAYDGFGLLGINSYYGWYKGKTGKRSTARFSDLPKFLRAHRRKYPNHASMITEFGAEATFDGPSNVKETFAFQKNYVDRTLDVVEQFSWLSGAIYWTAREFYVKPEWDGGAERDVPRDALHNKGLITYDGKPKPAFYEAQKRFRSTPIYRGG